MRRNLWKKVTSATLCAAMVGGIMVSNGALAVQAEEGEEKEVITLRVMGETGMDGISTDDAVGCIKVFKRYYWRRKYLFYSDKCSDRE